MSLPEIPSKLSSFFRMGQFECIRPASMSIKSASKSVKSISERIKPASMSIKSTSKSLKLTYKSIKSTFEPLVSIPVFAKTVLMSASKSANIFQARTNQ